MSRLSLRVIGVASFVLVFGLTGVQTHAVERVVGRALVGTKDGAFVRGFATDPHVAARGTDTDGDGVPDVTDVCNTTPVGVAVDSVGRPVGDFDLDCDTDLVDYGLFLQGFTGPMEPGVDHSCNPVAQTGCPVGQKCTFIPDDLIPSQRRTVCAPDGTVPRDGACAPDPVTGVDNCAGGLTCFGGTCTEICLAAPDSCPAGEQCTLVSGLVDSPGIGVCEVSCDPLSTPSGCSVGDACFVNLFQERTACAPPMETERQGAPCVFINGCATGYSCVLNDSPLNATGLVCAFICDASRSGGPTCADGPGPAFRCAQINLVYANVPGIPDTYGMCLDPVEWSILDQDGDTVLDFNDLCPNTPPGTPVDADGCPL